MKLALKSLLAMTCTALIAACGSSNGKAPTVDPVRGKHPSTWVYGHRAYYHDNTTQCNDCHGSDLRGGITRVDCFNQNNDTRCHANGHGPRNITHALPFMDPTLHGPQARADLINCQACHGQPGIPGTNPRYNLPIGNLPNGCETCHPARAGHPAPWSGHRLAGNLPHACDICHGIDLQGGAGPRCAQCHTAMAVGDVPVSGQCVSCHGRPPNGSADPNVEGAHVKHNNLASVNGLCATCHSGAGTGTSKHSDGHVDLVFLNGFDAKTGPATFDRATKKCSNVKCHGGKDILWTSSFNTDTHCDQCHSLGTSQYNGYYSGQHSRHTPGGTAGTICSDCHDLTKLRAVHFTNLTSVAFTAAPATTIRDDVHYNGSTCSPQNNGTNFSQIICHFLPSVSW